KRVSSYSALSQNLSSVMQIRMLFFAGVAAALFTITVPFFEMNPISVLKTHRMPVLAELAHRRLFRVNRFDVSFCVQFHMDFSAGLFEDFDAPLSVLLDSVQKFVAFFVVMRVFMPP